MRRERQALDGNRLKRIGAFRDLDQLVTGNITECLGCLTDRPGHFQFGDARRIEKADRLDEAVTAEARVIANGTVDRSSAPVRTLHDGPNSGPERCAIGLRADEFDLEPVVAAPWVLEQD